MRKSQEMTLSEIATVLESERMPFEVTSERLGRIQQAMRRYKREDGSSINLPYYKNYLRKQTPEVIAMRRFRAACDTKTSSIDWESETCYVDWGLTDDEPPRVVAIWNAAALRDVILRIFEMALTDIRAARRATHLTRPDVMGKVQRDGWDAAEYFSGPVFSWHCAILGIDADWAREVAEEYVKSL